MEAMEYCPRCDTENPRDATVCRACGSPLRSGTMVMAVASLSSRPQVSIRVVRADGGPESVVRMLRDTLTCGQQGEIPLPDDPFIMPVQMRFFFSGSRLAVEDVGGANGVFVRLRQEREVSPGGELRLGRQRLVLEPIPTATQGPGGTQVWGSPDPGYRLRLIQILEGGLRGAAYPLREGDNLLGREQGDLTFPTDGFVSGRHAVLQVRQDRLTVRDVGSSNGTFIRLAGPTFVDNGDHYLIGRQLLRVEIQAPLA
ncbi:FHA domain-containing protein [Myxococcus stipitatus DSM 14675]|uniref:FHA domain-containing protein n=1 Tax=Myxococcus stipitatus (strain DSM 14675 / JCM 12634 / Mx s8) TaxID=1278073 RepID=L7UEK3_MYXSD|nr:FHA domain-containing protein [Myxococcus stipitatus]AGC46037.1 FHA domain-containing protein [Myxococcus stipitatus DSM 14675]